MSDLFESINEFSRKVKTEYNNKLSKYDITYAQFLILEKLKINKSLSQKELLGILNIKGSTLTGIIDILLMKGLVRRIVSNSDKRSRNVVITEYGVKLLNVSSDIVENIDKKIMFDLNSNDKKILIKSIKNMSDKLQ